ncbi:hypothetical protein BASA81_012703 [Batrachochytrium salamandrivorans]|nr:hypothetical protein BASA81_012703 [Batrachochytrium salamandrivorans]
MDLGLSDLTTVLHWSAFTLFVCCTVFLVAQEYGNALESFHQVLFAREANLSSFAACDGSNSGEREEEEEDWGEEEENLKKVFHPGEVVVQADLGRGQVVNRDDDGSNSDDGNSRFVWVDFAILNDSRRVDVKRLLFLGRRLRHQTRGLGTLVLFDEEDRAHVRFDSGEYHRYQFSSWERKMCRTPLAPGLGPSRQSFKRFFKEYLLYRIDYMLSTFTFAKPLVLFACTYALIMVGASAYSLASEKSWLEAIWIAWTMVADPGTHTNEEEIWQRVVALALSIGGMLVFALMIGIIADGVSSLLDDLKQGHSMVIETGHTLLLGWSDKTLPFVREICLANESEGGRVIVILADKAKVDMETELQLASEESRGTLVVCRSGNPTLHSDLRKVSAGSARSVVILADRTLDPDESDAKAVRCILGLQAVRKSKMGHIVVEMCDVDNRDLGFLADGKNVEIVVAHDLIGRLMIQCAREPGLAQVIDQLMGFTGSEFYMKPWPELDGITFGEALYRFEHAIPIGVKPHDRRDAYEQLYNSVWRKESLIRRDWDGSLRPSCRRNCRVTRDELDPNAGDSFGEDGGDDEEDRGERLSCKVVLNPPNDYVMRPGDELVVLAEDDDTYACRPFDKLPKSAKLSFDGMAPGHRPICQSRSEKFLFCGWRRDMDDMILELDQLVGNGSEVTIMCTTPEEERVGRLSQCSGQLKHITLHHVVGNPFLRRDLNRIKHQLCQFGSVLILADQTLESNIPSADSRSLASLLLLRDMISKQLISKHATNPAAALTSPLPMGGGRRSQLMPTAMLERVGSFTDRSSDGGGSGGGDKQLQNFSSVGSSDGGGEGSFRTNLAAELSLEDLSAVATSATSTAGGSPASPLSHGTPTPTELPRPSLRSLSSASRRNNSNLFIALGESKRHLLQHHQQPSNGTSLGRLGDTFVKRLSSVGAALYFENAHQTGNTVLISEILDTRTKALISVANIGDHVMSNEIVAATLAMVSECRDISIILGELLHAEGNDLHLRSALDYGRMGEKIDFWQLQARTRARGEICLGYRSMNDKVPTINPLEKCAKFTLHPKSMVIVISED